MPQSKSDLRTYITVYIDQARAHDFQHLALRTSQELAEQCLALPIDHPNRSLVFRPTVRLEDLRWVVAVYPNIFATMPRENVGYVK